MIRFVKKFFYFQHSRQVLLATVLAFMIVFSIVKLLLAATPNPGHPWSGVGDGNFAVTGQTVPRTYTLPDASTTILTTNSLVSVAQGGTGSSSLTGVLIGNGTSAVTATTSPDGLLISDISSSTLTNKTINLSNNTLSYNSIASGDLLKASGASALGGLARGSAGQFLRINASGNALEWATVSGGVSGSDTWLQYNNSGSFGSSSSLAWNQSNKSLVLSGHLDLTTSSLPTVASTGTIKIFNQKTSGREMLAVRSDDASDYYVLQPSLYENSIHMCATNSGADNFTFLGNRCHIQNTGSRSNSISEATGLTLRDVTGTNSGNSVAIGTEVAAYFRGSVAGRNGYFFFTRFGTDSAVSSIAFWAGLTDQTVDTALASDNPNGSRSGFAFSTALGETNWMFENKGGGSVDRNSTGIAVAVDKMYDLYLYNAPRASVVTWRIDNLTDGTTAEGYSVTNLPTSTAAMRGIVGARTITNASRAFKFQKMYIEVPR